MVQPHTRRRLPVPAGLFLVALLGAGPAFGGFAETEPAAVAAPRVGALCTLSACGRRPRAAFSHVAGFAAAVLAAGWLARRSPGPHR